MLLGLEPRMRNGAGHWCGGLVLLLATLLTLWQGAAAFAAQSQTFEPDWYMVIERGNLMDENQEQSAINDAWRLNMMGTPFQVVTETSAVTPEGARQRADELRVANGIETSPGAGDGILLYAAVDPSNRAQVEMAFSIGPNAVPRDGMTADAIAKVFSSIVEPQLADGHPARAIVYPIRELMYLRTFVPPPVTAPEGWRDSLRQPLTVAAPVLAVVGIATMVLLGRQPRPVWKLPLVAAVVMFGGAIVLLLLAVQTQSGLAVASALVLGACAVVIGSKLDRTLTTPASTARMINASPRPPGTRLKPGADR